MSNIIEYHIVGDRPVQLIYTPKRVLQTALKYDWESGRFVPGEDYIVKATMSTSDAEQVSEDEFIHEVVALRARKGTPDARLGELYAASQSIVSAAQAERRRLTEQERAELRRVEREAYTRFESMVSAG